MALGTAQNHLNFDVHEWEMLTQIPAVDVVKTQAAD